MGRGAGPLHGGSGHGERARSHRAARRVGRSAATRQRVPQYVRRAAVRAAGFGAAPRGTNRRHPEPRGRADLDGREHGRAVRGDHPRRGRSGGARPAHGLAGLRALYRATDPEVRRARSVGLRRHGPDPPRELVSGFAAHRRARAGRAGRRGRHEPDGPRCPAVGGDRTARDRARSRAPAAGHRAVAVGDRAAVALLGGTLSATRGAGRRMDRRQSEQPDRCGTRGPGPDRDLPRHERHGVRARARTEPRRIRCRPRLRRPDGRLHGAGVLPERRARSRARARRARARLGRILAAVARHAARQRRGNHAAVVRPGDHAARARGRCPARGARCEGRSRQCPGGDRGADDGDGDSRRLAG